MNQNNSVGGWARSQAFVVATILGVLGNIGTSFAAGIPLAEILSSRAGRMIFSESLEGALASNRILGTNVANPVSRMERLTQALADARLSASEREVATRLNRIYDEFSAHNPKRAQELFREDATGVGLLKLAEGDRRLLRDLVQREFNQAFMSKLSETNYRMLEEEFLAGTPEEMLSPSHSAPNMSAPERALVFWETQKNAVSARSSALVKIEHFEIPTSLLVNDLAARMPQDLRDTLIFKKGNQEYVRWLINPEDTKHYKAVEKFLTAHGVPATRHQSFEAYQTASRSYIIVDPKSGREIVFSAKVSTNNTGGNWKDKKQPVQDAAEARRAVDFVMQQSVARRFQNIVVMDEPAMFGIREIDQAMLVRALGELPSGEVTYLPGFSALHEDLGVRIAHANGSSDPVAFWNEHYNKPLARAVAELAAKTGLTYDSPHSQNFLIEMVGVNPTGRIVMRDFGDTYAQKEFFEAMGKQDFLANWEKDNIIGGHLHAGIGVLHGNVAPKWMTEAAYKKWGEEFYKVFESEFSAITGVPMKELAESPMSQSGKYFGKEYSTKSKAWQKYFDELRASVAL